MNVSERACTLPSSSPLTVTRQCLAKDYLLRNQSAARTREFPLVFARTKILRCRCTGSNISSSSTSTSYSNTSARRILSNAASSKHAKDLRAVAPFSGLPDAAISALVLAGSEELFADGETILLATRPARGLLVLLAGETTLGGGPGVLGLQDLLLGQKHATTLRARGQVKLWAVGREDFNRLVQQHPELGLALFQEMSCTLGSALQEDLLKRQALQPYLVAAPKRGVVGNSKYAQRLRRQIVDASRNREPVLFFGEPGTDKVNNAALVHFGSKWRSEPMALLDCSRLDRHAAELFGRGSKKGLLELIGQGTLVLSNAHQAPKAILPRLAQLLQAGTFERLPLDGGNKLVEEASLARVIFTAEQRVPDLDKLVSIIKIAPLRVRPADIADLQQYFARVISRRRGQAPVVLTRDAVRHLESYEFPGNIQELESMMERAAAQSVVTAGQVPEEVFWFATQSRDRFRWSLLPAFPWLRRILRSQLWPELINFRFTAYVYPVFVALLLFGPQDQEHNFGLNLFWAYWWPGIFLVYPFLGRVWCAVCPFMIFGELTQRWRLSRGAILRKWPNATVDAWGGWFLFALFAAILVWEEVWDLPNSAALSGWLLIIITAGAVICSAIFERRLWCRHLCPIGGMNGLFAKGSMTELRARQGVCSGNCSTYHCYKGGPAEPPEGLATGGCPLASHPAQLVDNANCVLCMDCLKACPHGSVEVRLRPPLADIWAGHKPRAAELSLLFMLLGAVYLHNLPQLYSQFRLDADMLEPRIIHIAASLAVLCAPGVLAWATDAAAGLSGDLARASDVRRARRPFLETGYAYLPLVWAATLAHYLRPLLSDAGRILQVTAATVGFEASSRALPAFVADEAVTGFLQGATLLVGLGGSLVLTRKLKAQPWRQCLPQAALVCVFTAELWHLIMH